MTWVLRGAFVALIVLSLTWKLSAPPSGAATDTNLAGLQRVFSGRLSGPITSGYWGSRASHDLLFSAPVKGCATPLLIATPLPSVNAAEALTQFEGAGDHYLYAYLDRTFVTPDQKTLLRQRILNKTATALGLSPYTRANTMLFVVEGGACAVATTLAWKTFWLRT